MTCVSCKGTGKVVTRAYFADDDGEDPCSKCTAASPPAEGTGRMKVMPWNFRGIPVRIVERDGEPWFVAKDVAEVLGYENPRKAVRDHCKVADTVTIRTGNPGNPNVLVIPEPDLYRLITRSKLPRAQDFERWVMEEVLPSIRKTGGYGNPPPPPAPVLDLNNAASLRQALLGYTEKVIELEAQVQEAAPKVQAYERISASDECRTVREAAKLLQGDCEMQPPLLERQVRSASCKRGVCKQIRHELTSR